MVTFVALSFLSFPHFVFSHLTYVQIKSNQITLWLIVYYSVFFLIHTLFETLPHTDPYVCPSPPHPRVRGKNGNINMVNMDVFLATENTELSNGLLLTSRMLNPG